MTQQEHGSVAMGDIGEDGQCPRPCNGRPDDFSMRQCIEAGECGCIAFPSRPAQEPVACIGADDPEERCPRHPSECTCWQIDPDHPMMKYAAVQEPVAAPDGWQLVPIEPTDAMIDAGRMARMNIEGGYGGPGGWEAMLSAAPQPVINPTHSQVAGTPGLLTDPTEEEISLIRHFGEGKGIIANCNFGLGIRFYPIENGRMMIEVDPEPSVGKTTFALKKLMRQTIRSWEAILLAEDQKAVDAKERKE